MNYKDVTSWRWLARALAVSQPLIVAAICLVNQTAVRAADGVWTSTVTGGLWSDTANWSGGVVADGTDALADFSTLNIAAHTTVQFDAARTLGSLRFGDTATTTYNWTLSNGGNAANVLTLAGVAPAFTVNNGTFSNNVVLAGTVGFSLNGGTAASTMALGGVNIFVGDVSVNAGTAGNLTLLINNAGALGGSLANPNSVVLVANAATRALLNLNTPGASYPAHHTLIMRPTGASASSRAELRSVSGSATWNGGIVLDGMAGSALPRCDLYCDAGASTLTINGSITDMNAYFGQFVLRGANSGVINGNINVPTALMGKDDGGNWTLTSPSNNWGSLSVLNGTLRLGTNNALPVGAPMTFGGSGAAILDMNGYSQILSGNIAASGSNARRITNSVLAAVQSLITYDTASDITCAVPIGGKISLRKLGASTLTLSAASPYTGDTVISNGTLAVASTGSISGSTNIIIAPGATFTPAGLGLAAYQKLLPGDGSATLGGVVTVGAGAVVLNYAVGSPALTVSAGNLILSGSSVVTVNVSSALTAGQSYLLISGINGGQVSGTVPAQVVLNGASGLSGYLVINSGELYLTIDTKPVITSQQPVSYTNQFTLFAGANPTFTVTAGGLPPFGYQWFTNGVLNPATTNPSMTWPEVELGALSAYCVVTNASGAATSAVWSATVIAPPTAPYPVLVMSSNLVGYWRLNEPDNGLGNNNAGVIARDYWGGNNGLYNNTYLGQPGYNASTDPTTTAALFGMADSVNCVARGIGGVDFTAPTNSSQAFSVEAWVSAYTPTAPSGIVTKGYGGGGEQFDLDADGSNHGFRFFVRDAGGTARVASSAVAPSDGTWHHVVGVCDQPNGLVRLYVDGRSVASASIPTNGGILAATSPMSIGARYSSATAMANNIYDNQFFGYVNDVAIYNAALSAAQVQEHYFAAGIAPTITSQPVTSTNVNQNGAVAIAAAASGTQPLAHRWFDLNAGSYMADQTNATLMLSNVQVSGSYYLTVTNAYGTVDSSVVTVDVISGFNVSLTPSVSQLTLYTGWPLNFRVTAAGTEPFYYRWLTNGTLVAGATNASFSYSVALGNHTVSCLVSNPFNGLSSQTVGPVTVTGVAAPTNNYQLSVLSNSPVAYWPLSEPDNGLNNGNSGVAAIDYVGGHDGAYANTVLGLAGFDFQNVPPLTTPLFGFAAPSNSVMVETDRAAGGLASLNFARPTGSDAQFSVEAWVNSSTASQISGAGIVTKGSGHSEQFTLDYYNGGFRLVIRTATGTAYDSGVSATPSVGQWYHVVGVWDGPGGAARLFVNGANVRSRTGLATGLGLWTPTSNAALPSADLVNIGARATDVFTNAYDVQFQGQIAQVALYNYALSTNQIVAHYYNATNIAVVTPGTMAISDLGNGQVQLQWGFSGTLQSATNATGPYTDEAGAVSPYTVTTTNAQQFYRIRQR